MPFELVRVVAALVGWAAVTATALLLTRFRRQSPGTPVTEPPDDLPPGVVAFVVQGPGSEPAAATATLLDLAARGVLVIEDPGAGVPATVARTGAPPAGPLSRLESLVLEQVDRAGRGAPVPLAALADRAGAGETAWSDDLVAALVAAARERGLSRPRAGWLLRCVLVAAALVVALAVGAWGVATAEDRSEPFDTLFALGSITLIVLLGPTWGRFNGERITRAGRRAARAWLAHGAHLGRDELLRAAGAADVTRWGRRLGYAHALGTTRTVDRQVRFGPGDRTRIWSSFGGSWRQVEVRYPRGLLTGRSAPMTTVYGLWLVAVVGASTFTLFWVPEAAGMPTDAGWPRALRWAGVAVLLAVAGYVLLRVAAAVVAVRTPRTLVGEVLWIEEHHVATGETASWAENYYLAVDDGRSDRTTAWSLPVDLRHRCSSGDHVRLTVRPWTRTVQAVEQLSPEG
ncbi:MAG: DUF2207 domain-containing protein [Actinobacteria bacterium]|nr:DUF2207 domain-containing protein [Actinomycetota bacterium]